MSEFQLPDSASGEPEETIVAWRERILHLMLVSAAILGGLAYVPGVMAAAQEGFWSLVITDTVVWGMIVVMALGRRRIPYLVRTVGFLSLWFALAIHLLVAVGPLGGGTLWLLGFPVAAGVLLGRRGSVLSLLLTVGVVAIMAGWIRLDVAGPWGTAAEVGYQWSAWLASGASLLFLAGVLSLSIASLIASLERRLLEVAEARRRASAVARRLEEEMAERKKLQDQLVQAQKMEALGTLAGGIAHDFNNLLVPILMETQEVRDRLPADSAEREALNDVTRSAIRARDLVRRILAFSRKSPVARRPVEVTAVVREVANLLHGSIPAHVELRTELEAERTWILADPGELHQIVLNLASNGYLAMKADGGVLTLSVARDSDRREVVLRVRDTGEGMPPEVQARAFDPFFTTREPGQGTGLGLATVHSLVTNLRGTLDLESTPGDGTTVEIRFGQVAPPKEEEIGGTPGASDQPRPEPSVAASILVVDDEPMVRRTTRLLLSRMGYRVTEANGPDAALGKLGEAPSAFDLVLTDQAMPGMTGSDLALRIRDLREDLPIVLVSGYLDEDIRRRAVDADVSAFLEKPYDREELRTIVERVLHEARKEGAVNSGASQGASGRGVPKRE